LRYVVITSVTRDDLPDGGASHFARTIRLLKDKVPQVQVEVLIPDFRGDPEALWTVLEAGPDVLNHNVETVPRPVPGSEAPGGVRAEPRTSYAGRERVPVKNTPSIYRRFPR
jgi:lipoate synthase